MKSDTSDTSDTRGSGNTKNPRVRARNWQITINNPTFDDDTTVRGFENFIFQYEMGDNGTIHIQGMIGSKNATSFNTIKKLLPRAHIEIAKNVNALLDYCKKSDTSLSIYWCKGYKVKPKLKIIETLLPWQQIIIDDIQFDDDRAIHWYWEPNGNIGKTSLAKYICSNMNAIYLNGSASDMKFALSKWKNKDELVCVFDFPRTQEGRISYSGIEQIKNGIFFSCKYESEMCLFNSPHIICFANFEPDTSSLSMDRWKICRLTADTLHPLPPSDPPQEGSGLGALDV